MLPRSILIPCLLAWVFTLWAPFSPLAAQSTPAKKAAPSKQGKSRSTSKSKTAQQSRTKAKRKKISPRVRRIRQAFVASADLRPMARQLLQDRTAPGYAGVEAYARRHAKEDAGALAWLVV
ncbi:MAG TPA: hypothetical protein VGF08_07880, partial [Terriglobales bacterium]